MKEKIQSPITGSQDVELLKSFPSSITSDSMLIDKPVDNYICKDTGLIFNATGIRGLEDEFYSEQYDLHSESVDSEFQYYQDGNLVGIYDNIVEFIFNSIQLNDKSKILDIGCGKGILLNRFKRQIPSSNLFGIEPSNNAIPYFKSIMPEVEIFNGNFEVSPFLNEKFDFVASNGVLEHVPNPMEFLRLFKNCMGDQGYGFIGVPNFANNPADLFTFDHLSRLTPQTIEGIFKLAGLEIVESYISDIRVPMWFVVTHSNQENSETTNNLYERGFEKIQESIRYIEKTFNQYDKCVSEADPAEKIAIYGTGSIALIATKYSKLSFDRVSYFVDDNNTLWHTEKYGVPVVSPELIREEKVRHILVSSNPCYYPQIKEKIEKLINRSQIVYM